MISARWLDRDIRDALIIRNAVFIEEQGVPEEEEYDGQDAEAQHVAVYADGKPAGAGRLVTAGGKCVIGRVCVLKERRGEGLGELIVRMLIRRAVNSGYSAQHISAQTAARGFYEKLGFTAYGEVFDEAGIPHIRMVHSGGVSGVCG